MDCSSAVANKVNAVGVVSFRKESVLITALQYSAGYMKATTSLNRRCILPAQCVYVVCFSDTTRKHCSDRRYSISRECRSTRFIAFCCG